MSGRRRKQRRARVAKTFDEWGTGKRLGVFAPSLSGDESMRRWMARFERASASPGVVPRFLEVMAILTSAWCCRRSVCPR